MNTLRLPPIEQSMDQLMEQAGRYFAVDDTPGRRSDILRHLRQIAAAELAGRYSESTFRQWLSDTAQQTWNESVQQALTPAFTVGETYFRRDPATRTWLKHKLLPELLREKPATLHIWSAGCCTGEEAYDSAIIASESAAQFSPGTKVQVTATDLNLEFLELAKRGIYRNTSFRGADDQYRRSWFVQTSDSSWQIKPEISALVRFEQINLNTKNSPESSPETGHGFDVILCRNVLMYFQPEAAYQVLQNFMSSLKPNGVMLIGAVEASLVTEAGYEGFWAGDNFAVSKSNQKQQRTPARSNHSSASSHNKARAKALAPVAPLKRYVKTSRSSAADAETGSQNTQHTSADAVLTLALNKYSSKNYSPAIEHSLRLLGLPGISRVQKTNAMKLITRAYLALGNTDEAMSWVSEATLVQPRDCELFVLQAQIYEHNNLLEDALAAIDKALYLNPELSLAYFLKGSIHRKLRQIPQAQKAWQNCREISEKMGNSGVLYGDGLNHQQLASLSQQLSSEVSRHV